MIEQHLRAPYQRYLVDPFALFVTKSNRISANFVTFLSALSGVCAALCIVLMSNYANLAAIILLLLSGYLDTLDGTVARMSGSSSVFGSVSDILADRVVEFAIIFALFLYDPAQRGVVSMLMLGSVLLCVSSFLVVGIFADNEGEKGFHYSAGLMERAEAFCFFVFMILFPHYFIVAALLFSTLVLLTALVRVVECYRHHRIPVSH